MKRTSSPSLRYKNIVISGLPGAGSSTLGKALAKVLGWQYFSGGDFMRAYAVERGLFKENTKAHHSAAVYDEAFDRQVDYGMRRTLETTSGNILDSWLSGFIAQGVAGNLKVLVFCSSDKIRVDRIVNRDGLTVPEAKRHIFERETANVTKWRKMYSREWQQWVVGPKTLPADRPVWYWYPELYDLSIDTYKYSKEETLKLVLKKLGFPKRLNYSKIFA